MMTASLISKFRKSVGRSQARNPQRKTLRMESLEPRLAMTSDLPAPAHIVIVMEENHAFQQIIGNADAPFMNSLASGPHGALFTRSFAIEHPSQPNYLDLFSGSNQGVTNDAVPAGVPFTTDNLGAQLLAAGKTFAGYSDGLPSVGFEGAMAGAYRRKHSPWINWQDSNANGIPAALNKPFTAFPKNFNNLPTVSFVIPDQNHDMHDGTIAQADTWLKDNLGAYARWAKKNNSLLIVTWDEDDHSANNRITTIFSGSMVDGGRYKERIDHYSVLRTIEDMYDLPYAGAAANATPITDAWLNNLPTLAAIANPAPIRENAKSQTIELKQISAGAKEEQELRITAVSSNPSLIPNPTVNYTSPNKQGSLTYKPVANAAGRARIRVTVRDSGFDGILGNADDAIFKRSFIVRVQANSNRAAQTAYLSAQGIQQSARKDARESAIRRSSDDGLNPASTNISAFDFYHSQEEELETSKLALEFDLPF